MKTYSVLYAEDVPHYGTHEIEAENDEAAIEAAIAYHEAGSATVDDPSWNSSVCARIVNIQGPDGDIIDEDRPLDAYFIRAGGEPDRILCDAAEELLQSLEAFVSWWDQWKSSPDPSELEDPDIDAFRDIIRKARKAAT